MSGWPRILREPHTQEPHDIRTAIGMRGMALRLQEELTVGRQPADGGQMVVGQRHAQDWRLLDRCEHIGYARVLHSCREKAAQHDQASPPHSETRGQTAFLSDRSRCRKCRGHV